MTQEDKELLLQDLCARLPYGVIIQVKDWTDLDAELKIGHINRLQINDVELKPYLFPMSSMTEEQKKYISNKWGINEEFDFEIDSNWGEYFVELGDTVDFINWLNKNHFDIYGLIPMGLAIDATNLKIY